MRTITKYLQILEEHHSEVAKGVLTTLRISMLLLNFLLLYEIRGDVTAGDVGGCVGGAAP